MDTYKTQTWVRPCNGDLHPRIIVQARYDQQICHSMAAGLVISLLLAQGAWVLTLVVFALPNTTSCSISKVIICWEGGGLLSGTYKCQDSALMQQGSVENAVSALCDSCWSSLLFPTFCLPKILFARFPTSDCTPHPTPPPISTIITTNTTNLNLKTSHSLDPQNINTWTLARDLNWKKFSE